MLWRELRVWLELALFSTSQFFFHFFLSLKPLFLFYQEPHGLHLSLTYLSSFFSTCVIFLYVHFFLISLFLFLFNNEIPKLFSHGNGFLANLFLHSVAIPKTRNLSSFFSCVISMSISLWYHYFCSCLTTRLLNFLATEMNF